MQFTTAEGEILQLSPWRTRRLLARLAEARQYPPGTLPSRLLQDLRRLVNTARRETSQPQPGGRYPTHRADGVCRFLTQQTPYGSELIGLLPTHASLATELEQEYETPRQADVVVSWEKEPAGLIAAAKQHAKTQGAYIYLMFRTGKLIYVGKSFRSISTRLSQHFRYKTQHKDRAKLEVLLGLVTRTDKKPTKPTDLSAVEHALVRALPKLGFPLTNSDLTWELVAGASGVKIANLIPTLIAISGSVGNLSRRNFSLPGGNKFEFE